jgi:hypothetical protein
VDPGPRRDVRFVPLAEFPDRHEAELVRGFLEGEGIPVALRTDDAGGVHPEVTIVIRATVLVPERQLEEAREALGALVGGHAVEADEVEADTVDLDEPAYGPSVERSAGRSRRGLVTWLVAVALLAMIAVYLLGGGPVPTLP